MKKFLEKYYYKTRIIITFAVISILLVLGMSRGSYYFVKDLYLQQLEDQLKIVSGVLNDDIDDTMITLIELGKPPKSLRDYFTVQLAKRSFGNLESDIFLFNSSMEILFNTIKEEQQSKEYPELNLYEEEILNLPLGEQIISTPFKGIDGAWYLYSFHKISDITFLGIKANAIKFSRIEEFDRLFWLFGFVGIVIIVFVSWVLANSITRPVNELVKFSQAIGNNKLEITPPIKMKGELAILSKAMDTMHKNILRSIKERENMLAQIAHEIRNPLGGIELLAGLTKEDLLANNLSPEYAEKILAEVTGLKELITSYLSFSKPIQANPELINMESLLEDVKKGFSGKLSTKNITFATDLKTVSIEFDKDQLKHVLMNLIINSIDAISENGKIEVYSYSENGHSVIAVKDDGSGIENDKINKVFDPFFTTKKDGFGLGLAISQKYCRENNAELKLEVNPDIGVTMKLVKEV